MNIRKTILSLVFFIILGLLAGMLIKNLALGAFGGLAFHLIVLGISDWLGNRAKPTETEKTDED